MTPPTITEVIFNLLIVLAAGFISGAICRRLGVSMLVGYLLAGALIGGGGLGLISGHDAELEYLAQAGALLLLFAIGIEFSIEELVRLSRFFFVGGAVQMLLVAVPVSLFSIALGMDWRPSLLIGAATALSSTVLVFKGLSEWGQSATPHGRRAIGILLFQDVALAPLILLLPLLTGGENRPDLTATLLLMAASVAFVAVVLFARVAAALWIVPRLAALRSTELVVLFTLIVLVGASLGAFWVGLPPALGAFAAGLVLSGNRLSKQIDALILPYRESFAAVFFVTLGMLLHPRVFLDEPLLLLGGLAAVLLLKSFAAAVALRLTGLSWRAAVGMGMGLAQLGEFSFVLVLEGFAQNILTAEDYNRMLGFALGTLIVTPELLRFGLRRALRDAAQEHVEQPGSPRVEGAINLAMVIGLGPIGRQISSRLELIGVDVRLVDTSPVNLYPFSQQGFHTTPGDARDPSTLRRAEAAACRLAVVCVPDDQIAAQIVRSIHELNPDCAIIVRCRFQSNTSLLKRSGASAVVSEEAEAAGALLEECETMVRVSHEHGDR